MQQLLGPNEEAEFNWREREILGKGKVGGTYILILLLDCQFLLFFVDR